MENGWKNWMGKKIFLRLKNGRVYQGKVTNIDDNDSPPTLITILDIKGKLVIFATSEILVIQEEDLK